MAIRIDDELDIAGVGGAKQKTGFFARGNRVAGQYQVEIRPEVIPVLERIRGSAISGELPYIAVGEAGSAFNVYHNKLGQIVLDPVKAIPVSEAWLWENPEAFASVKRGLQQADKGETHDLGDFTRYAKG